VREFNRLNGKFVRMACLIWSEASDQSDLIRKLFANEDIEIKENKCIWSISNKYYSCKVNIHVLNQRQLSSCNEISNIGASIWCTTEAKKEDIELLNKWKKDFDLDHVDVQLIVVDNFDSEETKSSMNQWAIKEGVEIIDFSEDEEDDTTDTENIQIFASNSQKRIVEALQTVMWTELIENIGEADSGATTEKDVEDFEKLFANLVNFKETATGLPDDERRKFAEKVALSFYSALGDEEDSD